MDIEQARSFLESNTLAVISTALPSHRVQATVVTCGFVDERMAFVSRSSSIKIQNVRRNQRCTITMIRPDDRRYITIEGPAEVKGWNDTDKEELLTLLATVYESAGRPVSNWNDFAKSMSEEQRTVVLVKPERIYGSLSRNN